MGRDISRTNMCTGYRDVPDIEVQLYSLAEIQPCREVALKGYSPVSRALLPDFRHKLWFF